MFSFCIKDHQLTIIVSGNNASVAHSSSIDSRFSLKVDEVKSTYQDIRANVDANFSGIFQNVVRLAKKVDEHMILSGSRAAGKQRHRLMLQLRIRRGAIKKTL